MSDKELALRSLISLLRTLGLNAMPYYGRKTYKWLDDEIEKFLNKYKS